MRPLLLAALVIAVAGCGQTRRYGDPGGQPVAFVVHLDRTFVSSMLSNQGRPSVGAGVAASSGGYSSVGAGVGFSFSATEVYLLGGDGPAEAQIFIHELKWGDTEFSVPLAPGRELTLTVKATGGREGWESLGKVAVPRASGGRIELTLGGNGKLVAITPHEEPPAAITDHGPAVERSPAPATKTEPSPPPAAKPEPEPAPAAAEPTHDAENAAAAPPLAQPPAVIAPPPAEDPVLAPERTPKVRVEPTPPEPAVQPIQPSTAPSATR